MGKYGIIAGGIILAVALTGCGEDGEKAPASGISAASTCDLGSFQGTYLYELHGDQQFAEGSVPFLEVGLMTFDGDGKATRVGTAASQRTEVRSTLTAEVGENCVGELTSSSGAQYRATFSPSGEEVSFFAAGPDGQPGIDGIADRVSESTEADCDASSLDGSYQYRARGLYDGKVHIEHGFEVYDGKGGVTNSYRVAGVDEAEHLSGTYTVDDDCHAVVTYDNGVKLDQYVAPGGEEFFWIQTDGFSGDGAGQFGGHEHRVSSSTATTITQEIS